MNQARRRLQTYHTQTEILHRQQKELESQLGEFTGEDQSFNLRIQELQKQLTEKTLDLIELTEEVEAEKSNLIELMRQIAQANNMINQTSIQHQNIISNRERLEARQTQLESQRSEIQTRRSGLQHEFEEVQESLTASENDLSQVQRQYEELHQQADQITKDLAHAREKRSAVRSRHDVLHDMEHKQQGLDKGVRTLLERKEEKPEEFAGILTLVADAIHTDLEHAKMIETALAGRDQCVVVDKAEFLERHCPLLTELPGQVNFFPWTFSLLW